jgi:7,8-dihydropterin-6-yl-methyl-4-(beta-D-ribofuranosyl)aminobenzene 5'-phosphate synthase
MSTKLVGIAALLLAGISAAHAQPAMESARRSATVSELRITLLSTMLADGAELGEWGFGALVEVDGKRLLFDTGSKTDVVLKNAQSLGLDLTTVPEVILSHSHSDHTGGFLKLRDAVRETAPSALARTHVGEGMLYPRGEGLVRWQATAMLQIKTAYEENGGTMVTHAAPVELQPGVWLTGPVPRTHPERNWSGAAQLRTPGDGVIEDNLPEDMALVIDTPKGLVVLTGCGHAGVVNIVEHARAIAGPKRIHALIGGIHLFNATDETLAWTAEKLSALGVDNLIGAHCTGIEVVYRLRADLGLDRAHAVVGAVGATFDLVKGINPRVIAR